MPAPAWHQQCHHFAGGGVLGLLFAMIVASLLGALIPAFVAKLLMSALYRRDVSYLSVLGAMAITTFALGTLLIVMGYDSEAALDAMPGLAAAMIGILGIVLQLIALNVFAFDQGGNSIGMARWAIVLVAQYVVYFLIALTFAMLWMV